MGAWDAANERRTVRPHSFCPIFMQPLHWHHIGALHYPRSGVSLGRIAQPNDRVGDTQWPQAFPYNEHTTTGSRSRIGEWLAHADKAASPANNPPRRGHWPGGNRIAPSFGPSSGGGRSPIRRHGWYAQSGNDRIPRGQDWANRRSKADDPFHSDRDGPPLCHDRRRGGYSAADTWQV